MYQLYSQKVLEHFRHPKNLGKIKNPDGVGTVGNPICGDVMRVYIKVKTQKGKQYLDDIKIETLGCGAAIATASMASEMVEGKTLKEAEKLTSKAVAEALEGLPAPKMHCSNLAAQGIKQAIEDYRDKQKKLK